MIKVIVAEDIESLRRRIVKEINNTCDISSCRCWKQV